MARNKVIVGYRLLAWSGKKKPTSEIALIEIFFVYIFTILKIGNIFKQFIEIQPEIMYLLLLFCSCWYLGNAREIKQNPLHLFVQLFNLFKLICCITHFFPNVILKWSLSCTHISVSCQWIKYEMVYSPILQQLFPILTCSFSPSELTDKLMMRH